jgi:hypothetical protein
LVLLREADQPESLEVSVHSLLLEHEDQSGADAGKFSTSSATAAGDLFGRPCVSRTASSRSVRAESLERFRPLA